MHSDIQIKLLADCVDYLDQLALLWYEELGKIWIPNASVERALKTYETHANHDQLPLTYVAIHNNCAVGMISLRTNDGIREDLTPWLGSLIVNPQFRKQKIGEALIDVIKQKARTLHYKELYLFALDATIPNWYERLGWKKIGIDHLYHHPVTVMQITL